MIGEDYNIEEHKKRRGLWPLWGALTLLACGLIGWVLAPILYNYLQRTQPKFSIGTLSVNEVLIFFTFMIALVLVAIIALAIALAAPKKRLNISEAKLAKERKQAEAVRRAKKKRLREVNRKMREENRTSGS